ncbi:amidohydrolase family protein [Planctomicrobium sp. SH664]|uniref:amidohydrolase family protein n=1 Tax=Planctomicrobium sp. SH664 TaxID=3448125 RepID=UPI003F5AEC17
MSVDRFPKLPRLIDVNVSVSRWPFRRLPHDETPRLVEKLHEQQVTCALTSSFDALLHRDLAAVNERLVEDCDKLGQGILTPVGAVNLSLPGWESDVEFCAQTPSVVGVRIFPGVHDNVFNDGRFAALCQQCADRQLILQIVVGTEDPRTEHPKFRSEPVNLKAAVTTLQDYSKLPVMLLNPGRDISPPVAAQLAKKANLYFDLGMVEYTGGIARYLEHLPPDRLLFGSYFPFFYFESASLKLHENEGAVGSHIIEQIAFRNAERLLTERT